MKHGGQCSNAGMSAGTFFDKQVASR